MTKKTKYENELDIEVRRAEVLAKIPSFISPNGGSLKAIQEEHVEIYNLIFDLIDSLDDKAFIKQ